MMGWVLLLLLSTTSGLPGLKTDSEVLKDVNALVIGAKEQIFSVGDEAVIEGLTNRADFNGRTCHILSLDNPSGMIRIDVDGEEAEIAISNLKPATSLLDTIHTGSAVTVKGLQENREFNGRVGTVQRMPQSSFDFFEIEIEGKLFALRSINIELPVLPETEPTSEQESQLSNPPPGPLSETLSDGDHVIIQNLHSRTDLNDKEAVVETAPDIAGTTAVMIDETHLILHKSHLTKVDVGTPLGDVNSDTPNSQKGGVEEQSKNDTESSDTEHNNDNILISGPEPSSEMKTQAVLSTPDEPTVVELNSTPPAANDDASQANEEQPHELSREELKDQLKKSLLPSPATPTIGITASVLAMHGGRQDRFHVGNPVVIEGVRQAKYNGMIGIIQNTKSPDGRILVQLLSDGARVEVFPSKLEKYAGTLPATSNPYQKKGIEAFVVD